MNLLDTDLIRYWTFYWELNLLDAELIREIELIRYWTCQILNLSPWGTLIYSRYIKYNLVTACVQLLIWSGYTKYYIPQQVFNSLSVVVTPLNIVLLLQMFRTLSGYLYVVKLNIILFRVFNSLSVVPICSSYFDTAGVQFPMWSSYIKYYIATAGIQLLVWSIYIPATGSLLRSFPRSVPRHRQCKGHLSFLNITLDHIGVLRQHSK
jgi:hypothetical protein